MEQLPLPADCIEHIKSFLYIDKITKYNQLVKRSVNTFVKISYNMYTIHKYNIYIDKSTFVFMFWYGHKHYQPIFCLKCGDYLYSDAFTNKMCQCKIESYYIYL